MKITLIRRGKTTRTYWLDDKDEAFLHQSNQEFKQISPLEKLYRCCLYSAEKKDNGEWITELAVQLCGGDVKKLYQMKSEEAMETSLFKRG